MAVRGLSVCCWFPALVLAASLRAQEPLLAPVTPAVETITAPLPAAGQTSTAPDGGPLPADAGAASLPSEDALLPNEILLAPPQSAPPARSPEHLAPLPPLRLFPPTPEIQPMLPPLPAFFAGGASLASQLRIRVKEFRIKGNTVFSTRALLAEVKKYAGRELTSEELEEARQAITLKYVKAGYINSGAILPDQDLKDGVILFQVVEGRLTEIELKGNRWFRPWWLRHELRRAAGRPLNFDRLKTGLQLLRQNPGIRQINAELVPGARPGESKLQAEVKENHPFRLGVEFSNKRPPSVGAELVEAQAAMLNFTGHGDPLLLRWGVAHTTTDRLDRWEYSGFENLSGSYEFPVTPWHTTLEVHAARSDASIVEEPFTRLNIESRSEQFGVTLRQPFYESLNHTFTVSFTLDRRSSETSLLGRPFTLSAGAVEGETEVNVARLSLEYVNRSQKHVLSLRSTFNLGLDAFEATVHDGEKSGGSNGASGGTGQARLKAPDGLFFSWLAQAQYVRRLFNTDALAVLRLNAQLANDPLLSLEQFSLGGGASVRGYRENQLLRDNGVFASLEVRAPLWRNQQKETLLAVAPFADFGVGWDRPEFLGPVPKGYQKDNRQETLGSVGVGVLFTPTKYVSAQIYWGLPLNRKNTVRDGENLQDHGIHFSININAF